MPTDKYIDWTKYHIIYSAGYWKFYREGMKRSIARNKDRNEIIKIALYKVAYSGGLLHVHHKNATIDFVVDNWCG